MTLQPDATPSSPAPEQDLCLNCGLCCNGVLFRDVELQAEDNPARLGELGLPLKIRRTKPTKTAPATTIISTPQPCRGLFGTRCTLYAERPLRCQQFDCALLLEVRAGRTSTDQALRTIRTTRKAADKVQKLLAELGDTDTQTALSLRFQRTRKRLESTGGEDDDEAAIYADLTLAVHDLQHRLAKSFYP
ncbi:MAG: hypothetical protein RI897_273 [Verrucomicrobiota bacterium]